MTLLLALAALSTSAVSAQQTVAVSASAGEARFFPLEEIRPGMRGVAWTVFEGAEPEKIEVEILGVLPGFMGPRQSAIIARLSGPKIEKTNVFGGMSGSPVYIDGRLVGAISFNFPFGKEPIAGITPIKQMIDMFEQGGQSSEGRDKMGFLREPRAVSYLQLGGLDWKSQLPQGQQGGVNFVAPVASGSPLAALLGQQFAPIATPLVFNGFTPQAVAQFSTELQSYGLL
ncbi:MAG TPA: hypothetical protein VGO69_00820, partial [Pyrinomonadaceae bacterium]|nr:hypothetical protein [Pyrinomonadaceae bacterium]